MLSKDVENTIQKEDLPSDDLREMAVLCGMDVVIKLLKNFEGRSIYFPKNWTRDFRQKWVSQHWNGDNYKELGKALNVSFSTIYRTVNGPKSRSGPLLPRKKENTQQLDLLK